MLSESVVKLSAEEEAARRGRVGAFLLGSLQKASGRYAAALDNFNSEVEALRGVRFDDLSEADQDFTLADRVVELCEHAQSSEGYAASACLIAAASKVDPRRSYRTAWKCLEAWRRRHPAAEAPAMPARLAFAAATWLVLHDKPRLALGLLLCFCGLLRVSEAIQLRQRDLLVSDSAVVIILNQTKRGVLQKVVLDNPSTVLWVNLWTSRCPTDPEARVMQCSYSTFVRWLRKAAADLGCGDTHWSSHSLRRGGATELQRLNVPLADIMLQGRWQSARSAKEYLRKGDVALVKTISNIPPEALENLSRYSSVGWHVWSLT